jgi:predicted MPP superfamily phosphohydrolase
MRFRDLALLASGVGAGMLVYGALVESKRLVLERKTLPLKDWPEDLEGFRVAVISDLHLRDRFSEELAERAVALALDQNPDVIVLPGDFVDYWKSASDAMLRRVLAPLAARAEDTLAVPGNHDYRCGDIDRLAAVLDEVGIRLLRNDKVRVRGITWLGLDSAVEGMARPGAVTLGPDDRPCVALWHEGDLVAMLPDGCALQISGHSHGGQWRFPGGFTPMHSFLGKRYPRGWYPDTETPLYVSRGVGTTGPPTRFNCPPEVSLLTLVRSGQ